MAQQQRWSTDLAMETLSVTFAAALATDHEVGASQAERHGEFHFLCCDAARLTNVAVGVFGQLLGVDALNFQRFTPRRLTSKSLKAGDVRIALR